MKNNIYNFQVNEVIDVKGKLNYRCKDWLPTVKDNTVTFDNKYYVVGIEEDKDKLYLLFNTLYLDGTKSETNAYMVSESELLRLGMIKEMFTTRQFVKCTYSASGAYTLGKLYEVKDVSDKRFEFVSERDDNGQHNDGSYPFDGGLWKFELVKEEIKTMNNKVNFTVEGSVALKKALVEELGFEESAVYYTSNLTTSRKNKHITSTISKFSRHFVLPQQYEEAKQAFIDFYKEEEKLEVGKWYKTKGSKNLFKVSEVVNKDRFNYSVGFIMYGDTWRENDYADLSFDEVVLATTKEVEAALSNEAIKRGFTKGVKFVGLRDNTLSDWGSGTFAATVYSANKAKASEFRYNPDTDTLTTYGYGVYVVYENGKWADINKAPDIMINGYTAKFYHTHVEFGCAKFGKGLFESIIAVNQMMTTDSNTNRNITNIKLGDGVFTLDQVTQINDYFKGLK